MQLGKTVLWRMRVTMGSTTTFGTGYYAWTLPPVTPIGTQNGETIGVGTIFDSSTSQVFGGYTAAILTPTTFSLFNSTAARTAATAPTTFASGDVVSVYGSYEIA
jgi:hypothetical protein